MLAVACLYAAGVWLGDVLSVRLEILLAAAIASAALSLAAVVLVARSHPNRTWRRIAWMGGRPALMAALVIAGAANQVRHTAVISPDDLRRLSPTLPLITTLRGEIRGVITERSYGSNATSSRVALDAQARLSEGTWIPASGRVLIQAVGALDERVCAGATVDVDGVLAVPPEARAPGLFSYRDYLGRRGIHFILRLDQHSRWAFVDGDAAPAKRWVDRFDAWARRTLTRGLEGEQEVGELLCAMVLGWRSVQSDEASEPFMRSGTMHIFAVSGLNIAFVTYFLVQLLCVFRVPRNAVAIAAIPLLWFYTAATDWQPSALRATIMMSVVLGGWALARPVQVLNSLGVAAFLILLVDPQELFHVGFQLSFLAVLGLILTTSRLTSTLSVWGAPDPLLPRMLWPWWRLLAHRAWQAAALLAATSTVAWLVSAPLCAKYFNLFTPVALLANLAIVPLASVVIATSMGSLLLGAWCPAASEMFNNTGWLCMTWILKCSESLSNLPGAYWYVRSPSGEWVAAAYLALLCLGAGGFGLRMSWLPALGLAVAGFVAVGRDAATARITVLPAGPAVLQEAFADKPGVLIDTGEESTTRAIVVRYLRVRGMDSLQTLVLTHGVKHHVDGLGEILKETCVDRVVFSGPNFNTQAGKSARALIAAQGVAQGEVAKGDAVGAWTLLHPPRDARFSRSGDGAIVLRGEFHGVRVLHLSDLDSAGQQELLAKGEDLRADIVITSIPTYGEALRPALLAAINAQLILVQGGKQPSAAHALEGLLGRLRATGRTVFAIGDSGMRLEIRSEGWRLIDAKFRLLAAGLPRRY